MLCTPTLLGDIQSLRISQVLSVVFRLQSMLRIDVECDNVTATKGKKDTSPDATSMNWVEFSVCFALLLLQYHSLRGWQPIG